MFKSAVASDCPRASRNRMPPPLFHRRVRRVVVFKNPPLFARHPDTQTPRHPYTEKPLSAARGQNWTKLPDFCHISKPLPPLFFRLISNPSMDKTPQFRLAKWDPRN